MSDKEFISYRRIHNYSNPSELEQGKIEKEKQNQVKFIKKSKELTRGMLRNIKSSADYDESMGEEIEGVNFKWKKERGNLKTHQKRKRKFDKYRDFD